MKRLPHISEAEWEVMAVFWAGRDGRAMLASEVVASLTGRREWTARTIKTLINRLVKKGALAFDRDGKRYLYRAAVGRDDCVRAQTRSVLSRLFGNQPGEMLCRFVDELELTPGEIEELRRSLERKAGG